MAAGRQVFPLYFALHIALLVISGFSYLYTIKDFSRENLPIGQLLNMWQRWDSNFYIDIATQGYETSLRRAAFLPFYPMLMKGAMFIFHSPLLSGLIVSSVAWFVMLAVLYRLVKEDFSHERAHTTLLYLSFFPAAFFFGAVYTESTFLCLILLSFYNIRKGRWWRAGLFGFFATLTRSGGIVLLLPFCYEYMRQRQFKLRAIHFNVVSGGLIGLSLVLYALYCYYNFGNFCAFSHAQAAFWNRSPSLPWYGVIRSIQAIHQAPSMLSFLALRNILDLGCNLFIFVILILSLVGPWCFPRSQWAYAFFGLALLLSIQLLPITANTFPLQSFPRYLLEVFPAFILLSGFSKWRLFHYTYLSVSGSHFFFMCSQFVIGHWIT